MLYNITVLFLDDEHNNHISFNAIFRNKYNIFYALNHKEALVILNTQKIDVFICDERMPDIGGCDFLQEVNVLYPNIVNILTTAYTNMDAIIKSINNGHIRYYIPKPWDTEAIEQAINESYAFNVKTNTTQAIINQINNMFLLRDNTRNKLLELKSEINNLSNTEINTILDKILVAII